MRVQHWKRSCAFPEKKIYSGKVGKPYLSGLGAIFIRSVPDMNPLEILMEIHGEIVVEHGRRWRHMGNACGLRRLCCWQLVEFATVSRVMMKIDLDN